VRFIDQFNVVLLDMNGTFMFEHDRFGPDQDYFATYRLAGGRNLERSEVQRVVDTCVELLSSAYCDPERLDHFPTVAEVFLECSNIPRSDLSILEGVVAVHELGIVPIEHEKFLRDVARSHRLGLVSNIWSQPTRWLSDLGDCGLLELFTTIVFSSEGRSIKPSRMLFERALAAFQPNSAVLFAGDSLERDIIPAKALGLSTAWIAPPGSTHPAADVVVESLPELAEVPD
jgi:putative hydrolase of the HAD superfamily